MKKICIEKAKKKIYADLFCSSLNSKYPYCQMNSKNGENMNNPHVIAVVT